MMEYAVIEFPYEFRVRIVIGISETLLECEDIRLSTFFSICPKDLQVREV
jgi:hypothetical protein